MQIRKKLKHWLAYIVPVILVIGVVAGAGIWLLNVEVPIEYDEPYTISMSQDEFDDYDWYELPFREVTRFDETAYFGENSPGFEYYQHVQIYNPDESGDLSLNYEVESDEHVEFMVMDELVEPGDLEEPGDFPERESAVIENVFVEEGETKEFTVIHIVDGVAEGGEEDIYWSFYEGEEEDIPLFVPGDYDTIQDAIDAAEEGQTILVGPGTYEEDQIVIDVEGLTLQSTNGAEDTTIIGAGAGDDDDLVRVNEHNVEIDDFTLESDGARHGVAVAGGTNIVIQNNDFVGFEQVAVAFDRGGGVSGIENVIIRDNEFIEGLVGVGQTENAEGLYIAENTFVNQEVEGIGLGDGVEIVDEDGNVIAEPEDVSWLEENNTFEGIEEENWVNDYR